MPDESERIDEAGAAILRAWRERAEREDAARPKKTGPLLTADAPAGDRAELEAAIARAERERELDRKRLERRNGRPKHTNAKTKTRGRT